MARKTLLTEGEVRQFMKLANLPAVGQKRISEMGLNLGINEEFPGEEEEELEDASTAAWNKQYDANKIVWDSIRELAKHYRALAKNDVTGLMSKVVDEYKKHFRAGYRPKNQEPPAVEELEEKFIVAVAYAWASINSK